MPVFITGKPLLFDFLKGKTTKLLDFCRFAK